MLDLNTKSFPMNEALISKAFSIRMGDETPEANPSSRKAGENEISLVTTKMLETTNVRLQNAEHSNVSYSISINIHMGLWNK